MTQENRKDLVHHPPAFDGSTCVDQPQITYETLESTMILTRKQFFQTSFGLTLAGVLAEGCSDDTSSTSSSSSSSSSSSGSSSSSSSSSSSGDGGAGGSGGGGTGGAGGASTGDCVNNGTNVVIGTNHGHMLVVDKADVVAGMNKTYDITGSSMHSHSVTLTAADFMTLAQNQQIMVTSTTGGAHTHSVTVTCA